ncbi:MAG: response regulator, partial [Lachnospiraceae bacterium]|nr:response regulator [Lachnospiraceae bacterium]
EAASQHDGYNELFHAPDARILVIDDTEMNLTVMENLLKKTHIRIDAVLSGREGISMASQNAYDAVFIDHMMPDMDGIETLRHIREGGLSKDAPAVVLTANAVTGARERYLEAGFTDYLSKPVDGMILEKMLKEILPADKVKDPSPEDAIPSESEKSGRPLLLVVDDDETVCELVKNILKNDYEIKTCQSGKSALRIANDRAPELILLDVYLADGNGFTIMQELKKNVRTEGVPVLMMTGDNASVTEENGFKSGAADYIRKPFVPDVLRQRVKRLIDLHRYQRSIEKEVERQSRRSRRLTKEMMLTLSKAVDTKDHYTDGHSRRVAALCAEIGRRLGKNDREQIELFEVGMLHDIGKIGIHEDIIHKSTRLTDDEFLAVKAHTEKGYEILKEIRDLPILSEGARWHHERYDGSGYPDHLKGDEIPEYARIACVADCYDAMTSTRTYSVPKKQEEVRAEILRCRGTWFDPRIADVLLSMIDEDTGYRMNENADKDDVWKEYNRLWAKDKTDAAEEKPTGELPVWFKEIPEIDEQEGLTNCGSADGFFSVLSVFHKTASMKADEIERFFMEKDIANYTIKVHALKSSARIIGASALSDLAKRLEEAGKKNNTEYINANTERLLAMYRALDKNLEGFDRKDKDLPVIGEDALKEAYQTIIEIAQSMDYELMEDILKNLRGYALPE